VGIDVFVTGGIGGVHRGAERSMDVSADLHELGRTPMGVVCAGAKSILDLGLTLEVLVSRKRCCRICAGCVLIGGVGNVGCECDYCR
jgi:pseudouridine-5'-phosphate glycosidase